MHSCIALSTLFTVLPRTHRAVRTLQDSFNDVIDLGAEQGWRQDATLRDPHLVKHRQSGAHSNPERTFGQEALNKPAVMAPETKILEDRQNAVLPRCVVGLL